MFMPFTIYGKMIPDAKRKDNMEGSYHNMKKNELFILYGRDYKEMAKYLLQSAGLDRMIPAKDTLIGIKPNLVSAVPASEGATTHPEVVAGIIEYLQERGYSNLVILESSWVGDVTKRAIEACGYDRLCSHYGVPFWDLQEDRGIETDCGGMKLHICERVAQIGFLINVPVLKGHCQTKMTCALKNMKGLIPGSEKRRFHRMGLHDPIGHLAAGIPQDFILVDSICGDLTLEDGGNPVQQDRLIAAVDPVLCDAYACRVIGITPHDVPYMEIAQSLGVGSADLSHAQIRVIRESEGKWITGGEDESETVARGGFRRVCALADNVTEVESCSACYGELIPALARLEEEGLLDLLHEKICIGQGYRGKSGELGVGNCTSRFRHFQAGCPPTQAQMYAFLKDYILVLSDRE